jgi:hypothetical protein
MSDEVDDLLRRAMTTLDRQVPDGYFDTLAGRTLARLDDPALDLALGTALGELRDTDVVTAAGGGTATALPARSARSNRRPILAVVGVGLAAAAGALIFVSSRDGGVVSRPELAERARSLDEAASSSRTSSAAVTAKIATNGALADPTPTVTPIETTASGSALATPEPAPIGAHAGSAAGGEPIGKLAADNRPRDKKPPMTKGGGKAGFLSGPKKIKGDVPEDVDPKPDKPKLDKTSLTGDDIKRGMNAVAARVQACFAGTQGLAQVRLTVAPSGQVQKVTVSGAFAGTPVGACVERAVRAATFPPWDGGAQSVGYDYLLSE